MNTTSNIIETSGAAKALQTAIGGKTIEVDFRDHSIGMVFVKELSVKSSDTALACLENEFALAQLFTDETPDMLDKLTPASFNKVIEEGNTVNADFFDYCMKRAKRRTELQEKLMPGMKERLMSAAEKAVKEKMEGVTIPSERLTTSASSAPVSAP